MNTGPQAPSLAAHERTSVIVAAMIIGNAALFILGIEPILLGSLVQSGRLSDAGVGRAAMLELMSFAIASATGPYILNGRAMRWRTAIVALGLAGLDFAAYVTTSSTSILVERTCAGLMEGLLFGSAIVVLTHTRWPDRMAGLLIGLATVPQMAGAYLLPTWLFPALGFNSVFGLMGLTALSALIACPFTVNRVDTSHDVHERAGRLNWTAPLVMFTAALFIQWSADGIIWSYLERLADQRGYSAHVIAIATSGSLALQTLGAVGGAMISSMLPARPLIISGTAIQAVLVVMMSQSGVPVIYIGAIWLFGLVWMIMQPFQVGEFINLDPSRKMALLNTPLGLVGMSVGPLVASFLIKSNDITPGYRIGAVTLVLSTLLYASAALFRRSAKEDVACSSGPHRNSASKASR